MNVKAGLPTQLGWRAPSKGMVLPMGPVQPWEPARIPNPVLGQTAFDIKSTVVKAMLIPAGLGALTAYVGFRAGKKDHGIPSVLGYALGTIGALGTLASLLIMIGVIKAPIPSRPAQTSELIAQPQ